MENTTATTVNVRFEGTASNAGLVLQSISGTEALSRPFEYTLELSGRQVFFEPDDLIGTRVEVDIESTAGERRHINGLISRAEQRTDPARGGVLRITAEPWLWFLSMSSDVRVFTNMTVPEIIGSVFSEYPDSDFRMQLESAYPAEEFVLQWNESDFDFVSRLMEQEGIYYYFEHTDSSHAMVLGDSVDAYRESAPAPFAFSMSGGGPLQMTDWRRDYEFRPGKWAHTDYNFETPSTDLDTSATGPFNLRASAGYEIYEYPGGYSDRQEGERLAGVRIAALQVSSDTARGSATSPVLAPGGMFKITGHRDGDQDGEYLVTALALSVTGSDSAGGIFDYTDLFEAIPANVPFRPARTTPRPVISGVQTATVTGPAGEEIFPDEFGRVKVNFHWDRSGSCDGDSSCWIRVAQGVSNSLPGMPESLWPGEEVLLQFLDGDPDRPIIVGRINAPQDSTPFPGVLPPAVPPVPPR